MTDPPYSPDHTAEVRAHNQVMRYTRAGSGPLLLLLGDAAEPWGATGFRERLTEGYKVIVPTIPEGTSDVTEWLGCLLEGLGAAEVTIVAAGSRCDAALALSLDANDFVRRVILIPDAAHASTLAARYLFDPG